MMRRCDFSLLQFGGKVIKKTVSTMLRLRVRDEAGGCQQGKS